MSDDLFASIDALLARPRPVDDLPVPAERERLRKAGAYTQEELAAALKTRRETIVRWEAGTTEPRPPKREVYIRFLATLALQRGTVEPTEWLRRAQAAGLVRPAGETAAAQAPAPTETMPARTATAPQPAPAEPAAAPVPAPAVPTVFGGGRQDQAMVELDRTVTGELVAESPAPCVRCGRPTPYHSQGRPVHMGGWCAPAPAGQPVAAVPAAEQPAPAAPAESPAPVASVAAPRQSGPVAARRGPSSRLSAGAPSRPRKTAVKKPAAEAGPADWEQAAAARFPAGPLAVLDVASDGKALVAYLADGTEAATAPAGRTFADVVEWALEVKLGSPRLHRRGKDGDALVVISDAALAELGLPPMGRDEKKVMSFVVGGTGLNIPKDKVNGDRTAPGVGPGFGRITQWATEIEHITPHKPTVRADAVLQAPDHRVPVLLVEVGLDNESNPIVAKKIDDYRAFFEHTHLLPNPYPRGSIGHLEWGNRPEHREQHWRRTYADTGRPGYPPIAIVLGHLGERALRQRVQALTEMTRRHWQGDHLGDGYYDRTQAIPILFTSLELLIERGPLAPIWRNHRPGAATSAPPQRRTRRYPRPARLLVRRALELPRLRPSPKPLGPADRRGGIPARPVDRKGRWRSKRKPGAVNGDQAQ